MSHPPIIDAGPGLNFFSINKERLLIGVLGQLSAQETVQNNVAAEAGETVTVLIDDGPGARTATAEISRLRDFMPAVALSDRSNW